MNNIQKSFKKKSELRCMADGGVVDHMSGKSREQQLKEATGEWNAASAPPAGAPDFRNVRARVDTTYGQKPKSALQRLFGMADGGEAPDGEIKGPGGPTDDKVGPVMLSDGEYVLPADTVEAIGKDKLDAIRDATHKFVDSDDDGMANGGAPFYVDPDGVATRGAQPGRALVPARPPGMGTSMVPVAPPAAAPPVRPNILGEAGRASARTNAFGAAGNPLGASRFGAGAAPAAAAAETATETAASAAPGGSRIASALRGVGRLATGAGLAMSAEDFSSTYQPKSDVSVGAQFNRLRQGDFKGFGSALADEATAGVAGVVRGVGGMMPGSNPSNFDANMQDKFGLKLQPGVAGGTNSSPRVSYGPAGAAGYAPDPGIALDERSASERGIANIRGGLRNESGLPNSDPRINGADPNSRYASMPDDAVIGSFNGKQMTKGEADARAGRLQTASGQAMPQGDPAMAEIRSALRGIGGGGGGNWAPRSQADEINARYDALMRGGSGQNRVKGSDWSQRHGVDVEMARARELGADASNQSTLRGQNMQAGASADQTRMSGIAKMMELQAEREKAGGTAQAAATKAQQDAIKQAADANQQGYENFTKNVSSMFPDADPTVSATKQQEFMDFVSATDPEFLKKEAGVSSIKDLFGLGPQEQMAATQKLKVMMEMQQARNKSVGEGTMLNNGPQQTGFDAPVGGLRDAAWGDVANSNLGVGQYLYSNLPFTDNRVQELASGSVVPYDELVGSSADREKVRKSNLRNP